jgi:guanidinopropionase
MTGELQQADVLTVPRFSNVATFMRAVQADVSQGIDIAMAGVPFDLGTSFRIGSRFGPAAVREQSRHIRLIHPTLKFSPFEICRVADVGDAPVNSFSIPKSLSLIESFFRIIHSANSIPLAVGGDHTITLPILRAVARDGPIGLVHFDAHSDTLDQIQGERFCNGTPFRRAVEEGLVDPKRCIQIGIRETLFSADDHDWAKNAGITMVHMDALYSRAIPDVTRQIRHIVGEQPTYLSLDIDVMDPSVAPGTGAVEPGGFQVREMQQMLDGLLGVDFIGADLPEVSPLYDEAGRTARVAANFVFDMLCLLASAHRRRASKRRLP